MTKRKRACRAYAVKYMDRVCENCDGHFQRPTTEVLRGKSGRFCSKRCSNFARNYFRTPPEKRFWAHVNKRGPTQPHCPELGPCWMWIGFVTDNGYGQFGQSHIAGDNEYAHRYSFRLAHGEIPEGMFVLHKCDNRACVNPTHLYIGDAKQNTADMDARGRRRNRRYLTELQRASIRAMASSGKTHKEIAAEFNINRRTVWDVCVGSRRN